MKKMLCNSFIDFFYIPTLGINEITTKSTKYGNNITHTHEQNMSHCVVLPYSINQSLWMTPVLRARLVKKMVQWKYWKSTIGKEQNIISDH